MTSTATTSTVTGRWMTAEEMQALGYVAGGREIDYGMRWGEDLSTRVSFAPYRDQNVGFLYAVDHTNDRYLMLASHTTHEQVQAAWQELLSCTNSPDAHLALAALDEQPLPVKDARELLVHCVQREIDAYREFAGAGVNAPTRFDAASAVVIARSARVSAEQLLTESARHAAPDHEPVVIRYRVDGERDWVGRIAGTDLADATNTARAVDDLVRDRGLALVATSVTHGHSTVAAARVPELHGIAVRAQVAAPQPNIGI